MIFNLPKITVITPSYNQGEFIEQTILSVVEQGYPNLEYLILDGGSSDDSVKFIKKYARKYPGVIRWRSHKDKGQVDAINEGINKAKGEIISYLNSDDYYLPGTLFTVGRFFLKNPKSLWVVGNCKASNPYINLIFKLKHLCPIEKFSKALYIFNTINQPAVFLRKEIIEKVGKFNTNYELAFDYEYWLRCLKHSTPSRIKRELAMFRIHTRSKGTQSYKKQFTEDLKIAKSYTDNKLILRFHKIIMNLTMVGYKTLKSSL